MTTDTIEVPTETTPYEGHAALDALFDSQASPEGSGQDPKPAETTAKVDPAPAPAKPDPKPAETTAKADPKPAEDSDPSMPGAKPKTPAKPDPKPSEPTTPKGLREAYQSKSAEYDRVAKELAEAKAAMAKAREEGETAAQQRIQKEIDDLKKERDELNTRVAYADFTQSREYNTQYIEPLKKQWQAVQEDIRDWKFTDEDGNEVPVTVEHVNALLRMTTPQAASEARKLFGDAASEFMAHRRTLLDLYAKRDQAVKEWREKGSELQQRRQQESAAEQRQAIETFDAQVSSYRDSRPDAFKPGDDPDEKRFFEEGQKVVDLAFKGAGLREGLTPQQRREAIIKAQANVAAKASAFGTLMHRLAARDAEIETLKAKLAKLEGTEPGEGDKGRTPAPGSEKGRELTPEEQIDAMEGI